MTHIIHAEALGETLTLRATDSLFCPEHLDAGTAAMLSVTPFEQGMRVLDLGCGCGVVGILAAKKCGENNVLMSDVDPEAVRVARENAKENGVANVRCVVSNGFEHIDETGFDLILSNPPYQSDFAVAKHFIEKGFNRLKIGGRMLMVTKRREWYKRRFIAVFGGVKILEINGYFVFIAERRSFRYAN